jgi:hypothetical protein
LVGDGVSEEDLDQISVARPVDLGSIGGHTSWSAKAIHWWTLARSLMSEGMVVWFGPSSVTIGSVSYHPAQLSVISQTRKKEGRVV